MTDKALIAVNPPALSLLPPQADSDLQLVTLWLRSKRSTHTRRAYQGDAERFLAAVGKPLRSVTMADLQAFADTLANQAQNTQKRALAAVKSLLTFGQKIGYLQFNIGSAVPLASPKNTLAERILSEAQVQKMLALETNKRNHALLLLLYAAGLRVSELCRLQWKDLQPRTVDGQVTGQVTAYGKGDKTRVVLLPASVWSEISALQGDASPDDAVFPSRKHSGHLDPSQVMRIVRSAAQAAGITADVSPHWLRHAHATHALERNAPIHLVQATLGHASVETTGRYLHARPTDSSARYLPV